MALRSFLLGDKSLGQSAGNIYIKYYLTTLKTHITRLTVSPTEDERVAHTRLEIERM